MSEIYLVYSLDPRGWIDVYPKWVCQEFSELYRQAHDQNSSGQLVLGPRFFGSTIHWKFPEKEPDSGRGGGRGNPVGDSDSGSGSYVEIKVPMLYQTSTNGGYRSVECQVFQGQTEITSEMAMTNYSMSRGGGWRFKSASNETDRQFQAVSVKVPDEWLETDETYQKIAIWQWSKITAEQLHRGKQEGKYDRSVTLKRLPDKEWVAYDLDVSQEIEEAWKSRKSEIVVEVGLRQFRIVFEANLVFAKQIDLNDPTRVRVVKRNPNLTQAEIEATIQEWLELNQQVANGDVCPLCYSKFNGTIPVVTLECGHTFHRACLQPMLIGNLKNHYCGELLHSCPMCRDQFTSEKYTEITGDELVVTNSQEVYYGR